MGAAVAHATAVFFVPIRALQTIAGEFGYGRFKLLKFLVTKIFRLTNLAKVGKVKPFSYLRP